MHFSWNNVNDDGLFGPKSLFMVTLDYVSKNAESIQCLIGFPDIVGQKIFERYISLNEFICCSARDHIKVIRTFKIAYENLLLESLNLNSNLLVINEYLDHILELTHFITELCVCDCYLGNNHELIEHISNLHRLKKLCLKNNSLKDGAIRKITLPLRMFNKGPTQLEYLNLAGNKITDDIVPWLSAFKALQFLNVTDSDITNKGADIIKRKYCMELYSSDCDTTVIVTKGWASDLIKKWIDICTSRRKNKRIKIQNSFYSKKRSNEAEKALSYNKVKTISKIMIFKRVPYKESCVNPLAPKVTTLFQTPDYYKEAIKKEIFSQYLFNGPK
ncbi:leucine-rich repeat-containing protein 42-like isoform X2 [Stegodyphus dumicola]|uniref:leucine-rich repeat-containing protein 42-like isoform X2 n=1 Tax=Stegodyphus dumicola TaxID=202533 RepID=UPI0015A9EEAD|nr:leucine-rich repeat-containing protein 42-like isoform X2 [Stegodyphus dumicola]